MFLLLLPIRSAMGIPTQGPGDDGQFVVVLDAGHGGHDPGNLGNGYMEKSIALNIVLKVGELLAENPDIKVIYTRKDDTFVDLYMRGEIANKANADLFISVHCDSHSSDAHGAGTFVLGLHANKQNFEIAKKENSVIYLEDNYEARYAAYDINSPESIIGLTIMQEEFLDQSILLAKMMQDHFSQNLKRNDRKVKQAGFIVLHQTFMPSVLVETGFLTNREEGAYLNSKKGQGEMGEAIANAVLKYKSDLVGETPVVMAKKTTQLSVIKEEPIKEITKPEPVPEKETPKVVAIVQEDTVKEAPKALEIVHKNPVEVFQKEVDDNIGAPIQKASEVFVKEVEPIAKETVKEVASVAISPPVEQKVPVKKEILPTVVQEQRPKEKGTIVFKVQLLASSKDLPLRSEDFNGLNRLSKEPFNALYRYMYGNTTSYAEAKLLKTNADAKGYTTSYIVAYKDGVRIPLQEALKYVSE